VTIDDLEIYLRSIGLTCERHGSACMSCMAVYRKQDKVIRYIEIMFNRDGSCSMAHYEGSPGSRCIITFDGDYASLEDTQEVIAEWFNANP